MRGVSGGLAVSILVVVTSALAFGCGDSGGGAAPVASAVVGAEGGVLEGSGMRLEVPAGALGSPQELSVSIAETDLPTDTLLSPVFQFEPAGLQFETPATVTLEIPDGRTGIVFWTTADGSGYEPLGVAADGAGTVEVSHFSEGTVDECPELTACFCRANDEQGGLGCLHDPGDEEDARCDPDTTGLFFGQEGDQRSAWFQRDILENVCFCGAHVIYAYDTTRTEQPTILCRAPHTFHNGLWSCVSDLEGNVPEDVHDSWGYRAWVATPGGSTACSGYWIDYQTVISVGEEKRKSGFFTSPCPPVVTRTEWQELPCTLMACGAVSLDQALQQTRDADMAAAALGEANTAACAIPSTEPQMPPTEPAPTEPAPTAGEP